MPCWMPAYWWPHQPDHQLEDDEAELDHDQGPPEPTNEQSPGGNHRLRSQAQAPTQSLRLSNGRQSAEDRALPTESDPSQAHLVMWQCQSTGDRTSSTDSAPPRSCLVMLLRHAARDQASCSIEASGCSHITSWRSQIGQTQGIETGKSPGTGKTSTRQHRKPWLKAKSTRTRWESP